MKSNSRSRNHNSQPMLEKSAPSSSSLELGSAHAAQRARRRLCRHGSLSKRPAAAGKWVDAAGPGIALAVALVMQTVAMAWIGLFFGTDTTLAEMVIPLAIMGIGDALLWPACCRAVMSAVDAERAGIGSGLLQMVFFIFAALSMAVVTSTTGATTATKITAGLDGRAGFDEPAASYAHAVQDGKLAQADDILAARSTAGKSRQGRVPPPPSF